MSPIFIAALLIKAKGSNLSVCIYTHKGVSISHKRNEILPSETTWMDLWYMLSQISQRKTNTTSLHLHVESKSRKKWTNKQSRNRPSKYREQTLVVARGKGDRGMDRMSEGEWEVLWEAQEMKDTAPRIQSIVL